MAVEPYNCCKQLNGRLPIGHVFLFSRERETLCWSNVHTINPAERCPIKRNNILNIDVNCINCINWKNIVIVNKFYCWLGKQKGLFSAQCCCRSPKSNPTMHSVVWEGMVANHGVSFEPQQAMGYIAKVQAQFGPCFSNSGFHCFCCHPHPY